jgi:hypothetical protein
MDLHRIAARVAGETEDWLTENLYKGPVYKKIYELRKKNPEVSMELDQIVAAIKEFGDKVTEKLAEAEAPATVREEEAPPTVRQETVPFHPGQHF